MDNNTVALAALGILGGAVTAIAWVAKFGLTRFARDITEHTKAAIKQSESNDRVADSIQLYSQQNEEVLAFLKNLNGKLSKITAQKIEEQTVKHQTVEHTDYKEV